MTEISLGPYGTVRDLFFSLDQLYGYGRSSQQEKLFELLSMAIQNTSCGHVTPPFGPVSGIIMRRIDSFFSAQPYQMVLFLSTRHLNAFGILPGASEREIIPKTFRKHDFPLDGKRTRELLDLGTGKS